MKPVFCGVKRIRFGSGTLASLPEEARLHRVQKPAIIVDPGIRSSGLLDRVITILEQAGIACSVFDGVEPEPRLEVADAGAKHVASHGCDGVIGLGGGSALDSAKGIVAVADNGGEARAYLGENQIPGRKRPLFQIPTTAGTGSEVTLGAIFSDSENRLKVGMVSPLLLADVAIVDPELSFSMPPFVTACTGLDALIHAVESFLSVNATPLTDVYALDAIRLTYRNLRTAFTKGDRESREAMSLGSLLAGMSMANAGGAAVHAFAYPVGGRHHAPHGLVNAVLLTSVMRFNISGNPQKFALIARAMGEEVEGLSHVQVGERVVEVMDLLCRDLGLNKRLRDLGVTEDEVPELAQDVLKVTRLLRNNPRPVHYGDALEIYQRAF